MLLTATVFVTLLSDNEGWKMGFRVNGGYQIPFKIIVKSCV